MFQRKLVTDRRFYDNGFYRLKDIPNIDTSNDVEMVLYTNRPPMLIKDQTVFKKTFKEKQKIKELKKSIKEDVLLKGYSKKVLNAKPSKIMNEFQQFDLSSNRGLAKNLNPKCHNPSYFCTLQKYLERNKN